MPRLPCSRKSRPSDFCTGSIRPLHPLAAESGQGMDQPGNSESYRVARRVTVEVGRTAVDSGAVKIWAGLGNHYS
jgi:hypothetical protein